MKDDNIVERGEDAIYLYPSERCMSFALVVLLPSLKRLAFFSVSGASSTSLYQYQIRTEPCVFLLSRINSVAN